MSRDLSRSDSRIGERGVSEITTSVGVTAGTRQIAGQATLLRVLSSRCFTGRSLLQLRKRLLGSIQRQLQLCFAVRD